MSDEKDRLQDEDVEGHKNKVREDTTGDDTEGHMPRWEDMTGDDTEGHSRKFREDMTGDDTEGHSGKKVREDTTGDDDTEGHRRGL